MGAPPLSPPLGSGAWEIWMRNPEASRRTIARVLTAASQLDDRLQLSDRRLRCGRFGFDRCALPGFQWQVDRGEP